MKRLPILGLTAAFLILSSSLHAYPYCGGWNGGGYYGGGCYGSGWGVPLAVGVGFGAVAATAAYAYAPPVYAAPVYAAPVYYGSPSVGYYNPPGTVVVEQSPRRDVKKTESIPQSATLAKVQSKLTALGYYKGDIDGTFGPQTELAITKFQSENGLAVTGRLDLKTLSSLGITL